MEKTFVLVSFVEFYYIRMALEIKLFYFFRIWSSQQRFSVWRITSFIFYGLVQTALLIHPRNYSYYYHSQHSSSNAYSIPSITPRNAFQSPLDSSTLSLDSMFPLTIAYRSLLYDSTLNQRLFYVVIRAVELNRTSLSV